MKRQFSIRQSLLLSLTLLVFFTSGAILISTVFGAFRASEELAREVIDEAGLFVTREVEEYFEEVESLLSIVSRWAEENELGPDDGDQWIPLLMPLVDENRSVSSILIANSMGAELMLLQDPIQPERWTMRLVDPRRSEHQAYLKRWDLNEGVMSEGMEDLEYHTKGRLYYRTALTSVSNNQVAWTPPSVFFTTRDPGMTAATSRMDANGDTTVVAFDVLLLDVSRMTAALDVSERGIAFVLSEDDPVRVVGLPRDGDGLDDASIRARLLPASGKVEDADARPELPVAGLSGNAALDMAAVEWEKLGRPDGNVQLELDGDTWWVCFSRMQVGQNTFVVGTAAPQSDFLAGVNEATRRIALVALLAVALATILGSRLAWGYARPLEALAKASRRLRNLDLSTPENVDTRLLEIQDLMTEQERTRVALDAFARYIPVEIVRDLVAKGVAAKIGGERRIITVLFTDIEGFTTISESRTAEEVTSLLIHYFETLLETIRAHGGEVNQLLGDGVVAYWGAPIYDEDHAAHAVSAILECHERIAELSDIYVREGKPPLPTRFGVASGELMIGNVGSSSRLAYTAVGDTANLASRIEGLNRFYGTRLLVSGKSRDLAGDRFEWRYVDSVRVKGRSTAARLYEPLGPKGEVPADRLAFRDRYETALRHYCAAEFEAAVHVLEALDKDGLADRSVERLLNLAREQLQKADLPDDWDGVTVFHIK